MTTLSPATARCPMMGPHARLVNAARFAPTGQGRRALSRGPVGAWPDEERRGKWETVSRVSTLERLLVVRTSDIDEFRVNFAQHLTRTS